MTKVFKSLMAVLLMTSLCTSCSSKNETEDEPEEMEIEESYDVEMEEGEVGGGF